MRRKSIRRHFEKLCSEKYADQKKFWGAIKPYVNSRKNVDNSGITLKEGDKIIRNPQEVTETLNNFFTSCTQSTKEQNQNGYPADLSHISNNLISKPNVSLSNTNPTEVYEVMRKLAPNKASGCDGIPPLAVKESMDVLCFPLSTLINHVLTSTKIPQQWKLGEVTPILKKDCSLLKTNYRPITILPALSKVFEKIVHCRISPYFEEIYHKYVFAYRKYHGCDSALLSLTEQWKKEIDNNKLIGLVSMDLSKAFDTLPHELIVLKLKEYGADEATTTLIKDYLSNRFQRAMVLGLHKGTDEPVFKGEESQLPISNTMELFGVTIDDKLNFEKHIAKICRKVSQQVAVLKRMQKMLSFETRRDLYKAFILPHFNYCSETWHFCDKKSPDKLELVNKCALRFVFRDKSSPYEELCKRIGLSSLREQRLAKILSTVFKILTSDARPKSLRDLITHHFILLRISMESQAVSWILTETWQIQHEVDCGGSRSCVLHSHL
ncbi:putative RNA-directed DNA polymerase from transposon X-element [Stylophora pistillata]|uniref:Putative RNA-directed DNA polymerase from transposon X-element n=1 Tax=Stylophora pistillata TaxID=50429 RepID=A0A2B4RUB9_STYPI|nr:putative RNA-directed DNA polymerase from transposon X-element [Stylophora pistillata]